MQLEMFIDPNHPERSVNPERIGLRHLALKVDSCEEMSRKNQMWSYQEGLAGSEFLLY